MNDSERIIWLLGVVTGLSEQIERLKDRLDALENRADDTDTYLDRSIIEEDSPVVNLLAQPPGPYGGRWTHGLRIGMLDRGYGDGLVRSLQHGTHLS